MNEEVESNDNFAAVKYYLYTCMVFVAFLAACGKVENAEPQNPGTNPTNPTNPTETKPDSARIVIIGSSTAAGMGATPADSSWVNRLKLATKDNKRILTYYNLGIVGLTTYQGVPQGYTSAGSPATDVNHNITAALTFRPNLVIMSYPTNDVANDYTDDVIMGNYKEMIRLLDSAKVKYIVIGTQPRNFKDVAHRDRLKTLNEKMQLSFGDHFNNVYDTLTASDGTIKVTFAYSDGIHLNNAGHNLLYHTISDHAIFQGVIK